MWPGENTFARSSTPRRGSCVAMSITLRRLSDGIGQSPARYWVSVSVRPSLSAICLMALLVISSLLSFFILPSPLSRLPSFTTTTTPPHSPPRPLQTAAYLLPHRHPHTVTARFHHPAQH